MLRALKTKLEAVYARLAALWARFAGRYTPRQRTTGAARQTRHRPIHGDHGQARDIEYLFKKKRYRGSRDRRYLVHLPPAYRRGGPQLPVVMILHGCDQDHLEIQHVAHFDRLADEHGIIVVYPFVTSYEPPRLNNCWAFWNRHHNRAGGGEVEDLWRILCDVRSRYKADEARLHVAGLSSGGSMAVALLVNRCDKIASGAEIAGLPYTEIPPSFGLIRRQRPLERIVGSMNEQMGKSKRLAPLMIVHSRSDRIIPVDAALKMRESWARSFALETTPHWSKSGTTKGTAWEHERYTDRSGAHALEMLLLDHRDHGWYGGRDGKYGYADAPDVSAMIWRFFRRTALGSGVERARGLLRGRRTRAA